MHEQHLLRKINCNFPEVIAIVHRMLHTLPW
jgi:hypothetical protein